MPEHSSLIRMPKPQRLNPETGSEAGCRLKARRKLVVEPYDTISDDEFHSSEDEVVS